RVLFRSPPFYLEMEYAAGRDLQTWSEARGGLCAVAIDWRLEIIAQVADALQAAHDAGVIHRDVKPSNIVIDARAVSGDPPTAKLTDFGIGQVISEDSLAGLTRLGLTQTMISRGSPRQLGSLMYMAPE